MSPDGIIHHPTAFHFGPIEVTGFGLAVLLAFVVAQFVSQRELLRRGQIVEAEAMPDITLAALLGTLIGAKTYYVILSGDIGAFISRGGFVFWGGLMGGVVLCWLTIVKKKLSFARFADVCGMGIAAGYAVGRTGCWAVGDDYGKPWASAFAVQFPEGAPPSTVSVMSRQFGSVFPNGMPPDQVVSVHPTQLYETAMGFVMFMVLWRFRKHAHLPGWLFGMYCVLAGVERFIVEFFRAKDDRLVLGGFLSTAQVIAVITCALGVAVMYARRGPSASSSAPLARAAV